MNIEKYINSGTIRSLHPILVAWLQVAEKYLDYFDNEDSPWWYNERATLSSFAAAVWAADGIALEEYATLKGKTRESWSGKCDLYIGMPSQEFACEAKQAWCRIGRRSKNGFNMAKSGLESACKDARKLDKGEGRRLGLCFAVPYLPPRDEKHVEHQLNDWLKAIQNIDRSSIAWIFPQSARRSIVTENGYFYPGVALIIREVFRMS